MIRKWDGSIQKRILKAIRDNGGVATTTEVCNLTNLSVPSVHTAKNYLISRGLITKQQRRKGLTGQEKGLYDDNIYTLNNKMSWKINKMIEELENGTTNRLV